MKVGGEVVVVVVQFMMMLDISAVDCKTGDDHRCTRPPLPCCVAAHSQRRCSPAPALLCWLVLCHASPTLGSEAARTTRERPGRTTASVLRDETIGLARRVLKESAMVCSDL